MDLSSPFTVVNRHTNYWLQRKTKLSLPIHSVFAPRPICCQDPGQFAPWNFHSLEWNGAEMAWELLFPGTSFSRVFAPRNVCFLELSFPASPWHWFATFPLTVLRILTIYCCWREIARCCRMLY